VTATFPPYRGGTGNVCYHNAAELARRGHAVTVFTALVAGAPERETRDGIRIRRLRPLVRAGNAPVLPQLLPTLAGFDVIHLHYPFFGGEIAALAAGLNRTPLVITYHQDVFQSGLLGLAARLLTRTLGRWTLRRAQCLLFTSADYGQASYVRPMLAGREGIIGELPNGVDVTAFTPGPAPAHLSRRYGLGSGDQVALLVGALDQAHYFKGVELFLRALSRLPAHVHGVIVGDGDLRPAYQAQAQALGLADRVAFAGRVPDGELADHYRLADVTVLPSTTMGEAFGLVLVESLACATPVIASSLPGVRTVVDDGVDGRLVEPGSSEALEGCLASVLSLPAPQRRAMGQAGRRKVEVRYAWEQIGGRLEAIYLSILAPAAPPIVSDGR
jgi:glycosyltransferase involved in cell wall biosynthesis